MRERFFVAGWGWMSDRLELAYGDEAVERSGAKLAALQLGQSMATFQIDLAMRMVDDVDFFVSVSSEVRAVDEDYGFRERAGE